MQYVALVFYLATIQADGPMIAMLTGHKENQCAFDGTKQGALCAVSASVYPCICAMLVQVS